MNSKSRKILIIGSSCLSLTAAPVLIFTACNTNTQISNSSVLNSNKNIYSNDEVADVTYTNNQIKDAGFLRGDGLQDITGILTFRQVLTTSTVTMQSSGLSFTASANSDITLRIPDAILSSDKSIEFKVVEIVSANLIDVDSRANINHIIFGTNLTKIANNTFSSSYLNVSSLDFLSTAAPFADAPSAEQIFGSQFGKADCQIYVPCNLLTKQYEIYNDSLVNVKKTNKSTILSDVTFVSIDANKTVIRTGSGEKIKLDLIFTTRQGEKIKFGDIAAGENYQQTIVWANNNKDLCSLIVNENNPTTVQFSPTSNTDTYGTATVGAVIVPFGSDSSEIGTLAIKNITVQAGSGGIDTNLSMIIGGSIIGAMVLIGVGTYTFFWWKKNKTKAKADKGDVTPPGETKKGETFTMNMKKIQKWFKDLFNKKDNNSSKCKESVCNSTTENKSDKKAK